MALSIRSYGCCGHNSAYNLDIVRMLVAAVLEEEGRAVATRGSSRRTSAQVPATPHQAPKTEVVGAPSAQRPKYEWSARVDIGDAREAAMAKKGHEQIVATLDEAAALLKSKEQAKALGSLTE